MNNRVGHYKVGHLVEQMERYYQFRRQKKKSELRFSGVWLIPAGTSYTNVWIKIQLFRRLW